jgi:hypothetical protein
MPIPQALREQVKALLPEGDTIRYLVPAMSMPGGAHVIIVVSDHAVTVMYAGYFTRARAKSVVSRYARATRIGPVEGMPPAIRLGGVVYEVDDEYHAVINAADAELAGGAGLPDDPLPDL